MTNANGKFLKGPNYWRPEPKIKALQTAGMKDEESRIATGDPEDDEEEEEEEEEKKKKEEEDEEEEENDGEEDEVPWQVTVPKR